MTLLVAAVAPATLASLVAAAGKPSPSRAPVVPDLATAGPALLARRCGSCHGEKAMAGLDLRTREAALKGGGRGPALVPSDPGASALYRAVSGGGKVRMPPSGPLPAAERELLRRWIAAGAPWSSGATAKAARAEVWWAFRELKPPAPPRVRRKGWIRNPVDAFVLARLEARGLSPAPPASRTELVRRLYFDLTGLPPSPEEVDRFVRDPAPDAYEKLVDRLLASPRYGERWARHWLDTVRFGESQGFERDKIRDHAWRYRDYVIDSFNRDKPYHRFVREQVAGDVLPDATRDAIAATGFLVAGPWDEVGNLQASAAMRAKVREDELEDIVSVTAQTFLGLTANCARCHDHKFDPIPQKDYYRIQAALAGVRHGDRPFLTETEIAALEREKKRLTSEAAALEARVAALDAAGRLRALEKRPAPSAQGTAAPIARWTFEGDARDSIGELHATLSGGASITNGRLVLNGRDGYVKTVPLNRAIGEKTLEAWVVLPRLDQRGGGVITLQALPDGMFDAITFGERQPRRWAAGSENFHRTRDLSAPDESAAPGTPLHLAITYGPDNRISVYRNGRPYGESYVPASGPESSLRTFAAGAVGVLFGLRHRGGERPGDGRWLHGEIEEARLYDRALTPAEIAASFESGPPVVTPSEVAAALREDERAERSRLAAELEQVRKALKSASEPPLVYAANGEKPAPVHLLIRGDTTQPGERVAPGGLSCLPGLPGDFGAAPDSSDAERRRRFADWLVHPRNPLTPRVLVNRVWQYHFGRGIVNTPSDFGVNGERPSHPELLNWLASWFASPAAGSGRYGGVGAREYGSGNFPNAQRLTPNALPQTPKRPLSHSVSPNAKRRTPNAHTAPPGAAWSLKQLHRLIVTSSTYRQSTGFNKRAAAVDGENRLLWRMAPRRLEAEEVRDAMLAVSGKLNLQGGGPGFRSFNTVIQNSHFHNYEDREGPEYHRRSIYRTVVNSVNLPLLETFDCPDPSVKTPKRSTTTTPQQALVLLNNSFVLRQSRELAQRLEREAGTDPGHQVRLGYRLAFGRQPRAHEASRGAAFVTRHGLPAFCRALFNASEFIYVR